MVDYKEKVLTLVDDLNYIISDPASFPKYKGGKFEIAVEISEELRRAKCIFLFKELDVTHFIFCRYFAYPEDAGDEIHRIMYENQKIMYFDILRNILLSEDSIGNLKQAIDDRPINCLSFKTLANSGLDKLNNK